MAAPRWSSGETITAAKMNLSADAIDEAAEALFYLSFGASAVARALNLKLDDIIAAHDFGAAGDNATDDTQAIQRACSAAQSRGGGLVYLRPTGAPYRVTDTIALGNGVVLWSVPTRNFPGMTATPAQWGAAGAWLRPEHPSNPAVRLQGHGSGVVGINFVHNQPVPGGSFTPNQYGYCISQTTSFGVIRDVVIANAWNGIELAYNGASGGGTGVEWQNLIVSAFGTRLRTSNVNDTAKLTNIHLRNLYYASTAEVVDYIRANTTGWDCGYTDNLMVNGLEFFEEWRGILLRDETCLGNTHSLYNAQLANVQFNLCQRSVVLNAPTVTSRAYFSTCLAQQGNAFGRTWSDRVFDLASDNIFWAFDGLRVVEAGGEVMRIGDGAGGKVVISNLEVERYSSVAAGQPAFVANAGAELRLSNYRVNKLGAAGSRFAGGGLEGVRTDQYGGLSIFGRFAEADVTSAGTGYVDWSTSIAIRPGSGRFHLVRLQGDMEVFTAVGGSTFAVRMSGIAGLEVTGLSGATTGFKAFDTGWVEVTEADMTSFATFGRFQVNPSTAGLRLRNGSVTVSWK